MMISNDQSRSASVSSPLVFLLIL